MKSCAVLIFILFNIAGYSQSTINSYKYVLVPEKFDFSKEDDQYGLNTTAKQLLEAKGFVVFMSKEALPQIVAANKCNALRAEVVEKSTFLTTNLILLLKDCQGNIIFKSKEGKSREKEYPAAYDGALRDAFSSLNNVAYKYDSTVFAPIQQVTTTPAMSSSAPVPAQPPTPASSPAPASSAPVPPAVTEITGALYAQATANGYQLIDTTPKKILTLLRTSVQDYFIAQAGASNGIVFKRNGEWFFEHYEDNKLVSRKLDIKF